MATCHLDHGVESMSILLVAVPPIQPGHQRVHGPSPVFPSIRILSSYLLSNCVSLMVTKMSHRRRGRCSVHILDNPVPVSGFPLSCSLLAFPLIQVISRLESYEQLKDQYWFRDGFAILVNTDQLH